MSFWIEDGDELRKKEQILDNDKMVTQQKFLSGL